MSMGTSQPRQPANESAALSQLRYGHEIPVREFAFDFPDTIDPVWVPGNPWRSHFYNGVSLTMPYLEPFLVQTMREAMGKVSDEGLLADMRAFNGQEAQHYRCHRRLNEVLRRSGHDQLTAVEALIDRAYKRLKRRSLRTRMAYSAGFESMTCGFTRWMIGQRRELFANGQPHVTSFWLMHMVEETEHKTVAFDAYQACFGDYWPRAFGVLHGSFGVLGLGMVGMLSALRRERALLGPRKLWRTVRELGSVCWNVGPALLRALHPNYDPRHEHDPDWVQVWTDRYAADPAVSPGETLPLINTRDGIMAVPFATGPARPELS